MKLSDITLRNIISYIEGNILYRMYYSDKFKKYIPNHIREQIEYRINSMNKDCYEQGYCIMCGCHTTALQMSRKACDNPCYPKALPSWKWYHILKYPDNTFSNEGHVWKVDKENKKFIKIE